MKPQLRVILDCERMKYPFTGLYYYCYHLAHSLIKQASKNTQLSFYITKENKGLFGENVGYVRQMFLHKLILPSLTDYDLWHATHQATDYYPFSKKTPILLTIHDVNFMHDEKKSVIKRQRYLDDLKRKIDRANHVVTISKFTLDDLSRYINLNGKDTTVIYNGCNVAAETDKVKAPEIIPSHSFFFTIGTIAIKKNFHVLPSLLVGNKRHLVIAGVVHDKNYKEAIIKEAQRWNVADRVNFVGAITEEEKHWYYKHCEAFVFPSLAEGFGLPVLEAMYFKKPVFLSQYGSLPEIGDAAAYYFKNFDPEHMRNIVEEGLKQYLNDPTKKEMLYKRALFFSWDSAAQEYLKLYQKLAWLK